MLGWGFLIYNASSDEMEADPPRVDSDRILACWTAAPGGITWITDLVESGQATQIGFSGYPMRYTTRFSDVREVLMSGPPTHPDRWDGIRDLERFEDRIANCQNNQAVTVTAWDLS